MSIPGRIVLVTGSTQGVGRAVALEAARQGAAGVLITGREADAAPSVVAEVEALGAAAAAEIADLADPDAPAALIAACIAKFGRVDALVNVAALTDRASFVDGAPEVWERLFAVNARAPFFLMQGAIADMRRRGAPGGIVNILSTNIHCGAPDLAIYSATKGALATLTKNAANAHRFDRIRVNGINLGWADTPGERRMQGVTLGKGEGWLAKAEAGQPFGKLIQTDDVARLVLFLLSDAGGPITGSLIDQEQWVAGSRG
ncbi:SDR family oxidoreductase [Methylocapsa sp. S129]|uniref:SDR family oxidoreductase n=1 Tax=Methylocapsa sp. S129 TaxID=1641869 RepID=UPI00131B3EAB|nr:SDR family oxidoreductase [Methylocapsa sp. S129]